MPGGISVVGLRNATSSEVRRRKDDELYCRCSSDGLARLGLPQFHHWFDGLPE